MAQHHDRVRDQEEKQNLWHLASCGLLLQLSLSPRVVLAKLFKPRRNWGRAQTHPRSEEKQKYNYLR